MTSLKCPVTKQTSRWTVKTRIPTGIKLRTSHLPGRHCTTELNPDLHDNLKSKAKECTSFQRKQTSINWTDDEKRIYRNKRIAQSQERLQYFLPMVESPKSIERTNFQISHQLKQASCINIKRCSTSWTTPRNPPFITPKSLTTNTSDWLQCVPQRPPGNFSPFKGHKRKKFSQTQATKTEDIESLSSKWEIASPSFETDANILKDKSLPAEESNLQRPTQVVPHLTKNKGEQANKKDGHLAFHRRFQRDN